MENTEKESETQNAHFEKQLRTHWNTGKSTIERKLELGFTAEYGMVGLGLKVSIVDLAVEFCLFCFRENIRE